MTNTKLTKTLSSAFIIALAIQTIPQAMASDGGGGEGVGEGVGNVADSVIAGQRSALATSTAGAGFGPQSPRDIDAADGTNTRAFESAPPYSKMNLCNIHFHENAEHKGGQFTTYAGNGDGKGYGTGFKYNGQLTQAELAPYDSAVGKTEHGDLRAVQCYLTNFVLEYFIEVQSVSP